MASHRIGQGERDPRDYPIQYPVQFKDPPYPGQGEPTRPELAEGGQWIEQGVIYLAQSRESEWYKIQGDRSVIKVPDGESAGVRVLVQVVAKELGLTADQVFQENAKGALRYRVEDLPPSPGATRTRRFFLAVPHLNGKTMFVFVNSDRGTIYPS